MKKKTQKKWFCQKCGKRLIRTRFEKKILFYGEKTGKPNIVLAEEWKCPDYVWTFWGWDDHSEFATHNGEWVKYF